MTTAADRLSPLERDGTLTYSRELRRSAAPAMDLILRPCHSVKYTSEITSAGGR